MWVRCVARQPAPAPRHHHRDQQRAGVVYRRLLRMCLCSSLRVARLAPKLFCTVYVKAYERTYWTTERRSGGVATILYERIFEQMRSNLEIGAITLQSRPVPVSTKTLNLAYSIHAKLFSAHNSQSARCAGLRAPSRRAVVVLVGGVVGVDVAGTTRGVVDSYVNSFRRHSTKI